MRRVPLSPRWLLVLAVAALHTVTAAASPDPPDSSRTISDTSSVDATRLAVVGGGTLLVMGAIHVYQQNGWWKENRTSFHFREDLTYALGVDKIGHFYGGTILSALMNQAYRWCNLSEQSSLFLGAGTAVLFQTYVEVEDGFSQWGFDRVDFAANVAGAFYPVAQYYAPFLRPINLKFSYLPSDNINAPGAFPGQKHLMMDDYEGQTYWLSVHVNDVLPGNLDPYWPDFLALAVGYGARDILGESPYGVWFISLDYDMRRIIPQSTGFLRTLGEALNFVHFPAPAIRISPSVIWYGLYF